MDFTLILAFAFVFAVDSLTPGPAVATVTAMGARQGNRAVLPFIAGLVVGDLALFGLAVAGLSALAVAYAPAFIALKWLGIAYLLYMAWRFWTAPVRSYGRPQNDFSPATLWRCFGAGTLLPLGNPKAIGFYVAILPTVVDVAHLSWAVIAVFAAIIATIWFPTLWGYALAGDRASGFLRSPRGQLVGNRIAGTTMAGSAAWLAAR